MNTNRRNPAPPPGVPIKPHEGLPISPAPPTADGVEWKKPLERHEASDWCPRCGHWYEGGKVSPSCCYARHRLAVENAAHLATISSLTAERDELRKVLHQCEWGCACGEKGGACPLCDAAFLRPNVTTKHKPDCPLGRALGRRGCKERKGER